jgi:hypothetical protein
MRRLIAVIAVMALAASGGCRLKKKAKGGAVEDDGQLASVVNVADARTSVQLTRGFYAVEADSWRWTMKNFSVALRPPKDSAQKGATLQLSFTIPEVVFNRLGPITITARVNGADAGSQTFSAAGAATFSHDVPASVLNGDVVAVDFSLDKSIPPSDTDSRELGIIVSTVGLTSK